MDVDKRNEAHILLGNYLKMKRQALGLTQEEVGIQVGYSPYTAKQGISQIERGIVWIPIKKQEEFYTTLKMDKDFFHLLLYKYSMNQLEEVIEMLKKVTKHELQRESGKVPLDLPWGEEEKKPEQESAENKLEKLKALFDKGLIDETEYKEAKQRVLEEFIK